MFTVSSFFNLVSDSSDKDIKTFENRQNSLSQSSQKRKGSFRVSREFTRIFSFLARVIRCLLSVVRSQISKIRVDT